QETRRQRPAERPADGESGNPGNCECEQAEPDRRALVLLEHVQVELEPGHEHEVEQTELSELRNGLVPGVDEVEAVTADQESADDETDQSGQPEPADDDRPEQDHGEEDEKLEDRAVDVSDRAQHLNPRSGSRARLPGSSLATSRLGGRSFHPPAGSGSWNPR